MFLKYFHVASEKIASLAECSTHERYFLLVSILHFPLPAQPFSSVSKMRANVLLVSFPLKLKMLKVSDNSPERYFICICSLKIIYSGKKYIYPLFLPEVNISSFWL